MRAAPRVRRASGNCRWTARHPRLPTPLRAPPASMFGRFPSRQRFSPGSSRWLLPDASFCLRMNVNGNATELDVHPVARLLDVLRERLHLTGTKEGCGEGECGACSVMMNGRLVNSCLIPALQADGATISTIEGVAGDATLHGVQQAFIDHGGAQCGICTPGMILAANDLLSRTPNPSIDDIRHGLSGNLCRCTGYMRIFEAVVAAVKAGTA